MTEIRWRIVRGSAGAFLDPPGSPQHTFEVLGFEGRRHEPFAIMSLQGALSDADVGEGIKRRVRQMLSDAQMTCSEEWLRQVYGYFKNCYSPDGVNRNVSDCIIDRAQKMPAEKHLAYLFVKRWFPEHEPRLDLIASGGDYGSKTCAKCGKTIQYESKYDGWAVFGETPACPEGGDHKPVRPE